MNNLQLNRSVFSLVISVLISISANSQINERFTLRSLPDNGWTLSFKRNGTYLYFKSNMFTESSKTLDSGDYILRNDTLILTSRFNLEDKKRVSKFYVLHRYLFKKKANICNPLSPRYNQKNHIFRKRIIAIGRQRVKREDFLCNSQ